MPERDALQAMREQVDAAYASAERLVRDAEAAAREHVAGVPPRGWASDEPAPAPKPSASVEALQAIAGLLEVARGTVPPELTQQFAAALRELLTAVRALIDWYLERLDAAPVKAREVEEIPID